MSPAIDALNKSVELRRRGSALDSFFLATAHWRKGEKNEARQWYDKALGWMEKNAPRNNELGQLRTEAAVVLGMSEKIESTSPIERQTTPPSKP